MKKLLTVIIDGFGYREDKKGNAIMDANPVNFMKLWNEYPHTTLYASGETIGYVEDQIPDGKLNYMTIAAGRNIQPNKELVDKFLSTEIRDNETFLNMISYLKETDKVVHITGLFSDSMIHADMNHFLSLYDELTEFGIKKINFNIITDGKNTKDHECYNYIEVLEDKIKENDLAGIGSVCGRYYAMDRNQNWDLTKNYYDLICNAKGVKAKNLKEIINKCYEKKMNDENIPPLATEHYRKINDGDVVIWMNFRTDSSRQILESLTNPNFKEFSVNKYDNLRVYTFFDIGKNVNTISVLEPDKINNPLGVYVSKLGLTQVRIGEEEKFSYITTVFDGDYTGQVEGCTRYQIPSPEVRSYVKKPQMSAVEVTKKAISAMERDVDLVLVNYSNPDVLAHTGNYEATTKSIMAVDLCLSKLIEEAENNFYKVIILGSHGNAEEMLDENGEITTTHTLNKVPFIITDKDVSLKEDGSIINVAPTILDYMDIALPEEMKQTDTLIIKN